jgi:hypothetical protein
MGQWYCSSVGARGNCHEQVSISNYAAAGGRTRLRVTAASFGTRVPSKNRGFCYFFDWPAAGF